MLCVDRLCSLQRSKNEHLGLRMEIWRWLFFFLIEGVIDLCCEFQWLFVFPI